MLSQHAPPTDKGHTCIASDAFKYKSWTCESDTQQSNWHVSGSMQAPSLHAMEKLHSDEMLHQATFRETTLVVLCQPLTAMLHGWQGSLSQGECPWHENAVLSPAQGNRSTTDWMVNEAKGWRKSGSL